MPLLGHVVRRVKRQRPAGHSLIVVVILRRVRRSAAMLASIRSSTVSRRHTSPAQVAVTPLILIVAVLTAFAASLQLRGR
jgi:hypothetical protein